MPGHPEVQNSPSGCVVCQIAIIINQIARVPKLHFEAKHKSLTNSLECIGALTFALLVTAVQSREKTEERGKQIVQKNYDAS